MKKAAALILAILMCLTLMVGCGGRESAKTAATNALTALQKLDNDGIVKYFGEDASITDSLGGNELSEQMLSSIMGGMTFKVGTVNEDGDTATAAVTLTNKDMNKVTSNFITALLTDMMSGKVTEDSMTEEASLQYFLDAMAANTDTVSNDVTLSMTYTEETGWLIVADAALADAMTGNAITAFSNFAA